MERDVILAYRPYQNRPADVNSTFMQAVGAGVRQGNDIYNLFQYATRNDFVYDPEFSPSSYAEESQNDLWERHWAELVQAGSQDEFEDMVLRLRQRERDLSILSDQGWTGFAIAAASGLVSPTTLIPFVGPSRGALGVAEAFGLALAASALQEAPIALNQLGDSNAEIALNIGAGTVLGGLLGSAAVMLRGEARLRLGDDLLPDREPTHVGAIVREADGAVRLQGRVARIAPPVEDGFGPQVRNVFDEVAEDVPTRQTNEVQPNVFREESFISPGQRVQPRAEAPTKNVFTPSAENLFAPQDNLFRPAERPNLFQPDDNAFLDDMSLLTQDTSNIFRAEDTPDNLFRPSALPEDDDLMPPAMRSLFRGTPQSLIPERVNELPEPTARIEPQETMPAREAMAGGGSLSAASATGRFVPPEAVSEGFTGRSAGDLAPVGPRNVGKALTRTSPGATLVRQPFMPKGMKSQVLQDVSQRLTDSGLYYEGNNFGIATAPGGTVEAGKKRFQAQLANFYIGQRRAYLEYLADGKGVTRKLRTAQKLRDVAGTAPKGKMTYAEFKESVIDAANVPEAPVAPQVASAAKLLRQTLDWVNVQALDATQGRGAKALYNVDIDYGTPHHFSAEKIVLDRPRFVDLVSSHYRAKLANFYSQKVNKLRRFEEAAGDNETLLSLSRNEAMEEMARIEEALSKVYDPARDDPRIDRIRELRDEARALRDEEMEKIINELPENLREDSESKRAAKKTASQRVAEKAQALKDEADQLEAALSQRTKDAKAKRAQLRSQLNTIRRSFGAYEEKRAATLAKIEDNEELNLRALTRVVNGTRRFVADAGRLSPERLDAEMQRLTSSLEKQIELVDKGRARLEKLGPDADPKKFEMESTRQLVRTLKEMRLARDVNRVPQEWAARAAEVQARLDEVTGRVNEINNSRAMRNQRLLDQAENYSPERVKADIDSMRAKTAEKWEKLERELEGFFGTGNVNFRDLDFDEASRQMAEDLATKIIGNYSRVGEFEAMMGMRGPMKLRVLDIPYQEKKAFLETDSEVLMGRYMQTMGADIELYRAYGSINAKTAVESIKEDFGRLREKMEANPDLSAEQKVQKRTELNHAEEVGVHTFMDLVERLRGTRGLVNGRSGWGTRLGRIALNWNVASMMGTVTISSISDAHRAVTAYGLHHTFKTSWMPLIKSLVSEADKELTDAARDRLKKMGIGIESMVGEGRAQNFLELMQPDPFQSRAERMFEKFSASMPFVALFGAWTDSMKLVTGMASMASIVRNVEDAAAGRATAEQIRELASMNIDGPAAARIWASMEDEGGSDLVNGTRLPNSGAWMDREAARIFETAMIRESDRLIIDPGLERPLWTDANLPARLISQFRSFMFSANSKQLVASLQARGRNQIMNTVSGFLTSMGLGAVSYYIWGMTAGEKQREEMRNAPWEVWADQALMRSGYLGILGEVQNIGSAVPLTADYVTFSGSQLAGRRADNLMGAILGPTFGRAWDVATMIQGIDNPTQGTTNQARKMLPWQNVFYLKWALDQVENGVNSVLNLPETRR